MTRQSETWPNFLWGVRFRKIFLLPYASSPSILGDLIGSWVSESCNWSASGVLHSRTESFRSGRSILHDLLVIRDHWCWKKREPIATANSVQSIVESSWFLKKVDYGHNENWFFKYFGLYILIGSYMSSFMYAPGHHWPDISKTQPLDLDHGLSEGTGAV